MKLFFVVSCLLIQLALADPPNPYYKVIFDKGHALTTANSDEYKTLDIEYVNDLFVFKFLHKFHWSHDQYMVIQRNEKKWSELSFVIEYKPGHKCDDAPPHLKPHIKKCKGDMELRDLTDAEKAKIAKSKDTIAVITDKDTLLAYKVTYNEAKIMVEQSGDMKQVKVEDVFNPGSQKIHALVAPGKEAYIIMHNDDPMKKEQFVVESTPDPKTDCTKTSLARLLCWCSGNLKLREMTADEKASFSLT